MHATLPVSELLISYRIEVVHAERGKEIVSAFSSCCFRRCTSRNYISGHGSSGGADLPNCAKARCVGAPLLAAAEPSANPSLLDSLDLHEDLKERI